MKKYKMLVWRLIPIVLVVALTIGMSELFFRNRIETETELSWTELATAQNEASLKISDQLGANLTILDLVADAITTYASIQDHDTTLAYLSNVRDRSLFDRIDIIFPDGTILLPNGERITDTGEKTYAELLAKGSHMSQRVTDFYTGQACIHAFSPVYDANGQNIAILGATVYCSTLADTFMSAHYGEKAQLYLLDLRDGNIVFSRQGLGNVYHSDVTEVGEEFQNIDIVEQLMQGRSGHVNYVSPINGQLSYMAFAPVKGTDFTLAMVVQEDVALAGVNALRKTLNRVAIVETLAVLGFVIWIYLIMKKAAQNESRAREAELALLHQQEKELKNQYAVAANRKEFLEQMAISLPGGYHRCTTDHSFRVSFASNSFEQITGYTLRQLQEEMGGSYMGIVLPEDRAYFMSLAPQLEKEGSIQCAYRIRRRDGSIRWVQDSTQHVERNGEEYYQCTLADITDEIEEIQRARQQAEDSSHAKSTFLFNISHDIRTPMNAIKGFSRIIEENADNPQLVLKTVAKIHQAGDALMMLMNDVLDISRIERGKEELNLEPTELYEHGKNLYEMFASDMQAAGITFLGEGDRADDYVLCDRLKLTRIIMNMLSNAKKFTPKGGTVAFGSKRLERTEETCTYRFYVRDTGIGMSDEFKNRAFEQFERERTSTQSGVAGSGLGLAIIKMLVELMGGKIELTSEEGHGTEIAAILTFRLADREAASSAQAENRQINLSGRRVLLVEDNEFNREIARYILQGLQLEVEEAEDGSVCLEMLQSAQPGHYDVILMDIQMPVMDGYAATAHIRSLENKALASVPILAMTANAFEEDRRKCLEIGMNGHIGKPIEVEDLMSALSQVLGKEADQR